MAFADDLVLLTNSAWEMECLMKECEDFFDGNGLKVNHKKCLSLRTLPVKGKKALKVVTRDHRFWKGEAMPTMSYESMAKYLGVRLDPEGAIKLPEQQWKDWFNNVNTAPLKPEQKIIAIKTCIVPRMIFQLRVADAGIAKLRKINTMVKIWFKKVLHLPEWTPDCWIHLKAGGELTNIIESILKMRKKASEKMVNSEDKVAHEVAVDLDVINCDSLNRIELNMSTKEIAREVKRRRIERLEKLTNGKALKTMAETHTKRDWMWYGTSMKSTNRIVCWKILSGTLSTKINKTRGRVNRVEKMCRHCGCSAETDLHILAECRKTKDVRCK